MTHLAKFLLFTTIAAGSAMAAPPFGTWKMNPAKSHFDPGTPSLKSFTLQFDPAGNGAIRVTATGETADGTPFHTSYVLKDDGKDYPVTNAPFDTISDTPVDANTDRIVTKRNGTVLERTRVLVAGNTMTEISELPGSHNLVVLEKQ